MYWCCFVTDLIKETLTNSFLLSSVYGKEARGISQIEDKIPEDMSGLTKAMCFYSDHAQNQIKVVMD